MSKKISRVLLLSLSLIFTANCSLAEGQTDPAPSPANTHSNSNKISYSALSPDEREIINNGSIGGVQYVLGGLSATFLGLGIGQAVEGRYLPLGLVFTVGELASVGLMAAGVVDCTTQALSYSNTQNCSNTSAFTIGILAFVGLRVWEIVDAWAAPPSINSRYNNLKDHVDMTSNHFFISPVTLARANGNATTGGEFGVQFRF